MQLTLVSHYGNKSRQLSDFIKVLQQHVSQLIPVAFDPYDLEQVHGTIVGLEGIVTENGVINQNFKNLRDEERVMDWAGLLAFLRSSDFPRINIRIGGYRQEEDYEFKSRGQHPFLRSFSIQGETSVVIGWPLGPKDCSQSKDHLNESPLDNLRRSFQQFGVLHKWHKTPETIDNDFFFVLGKIDSLKSTKEELTAVEEELRLGLAKTRLEFELSASTLSVVSYSNTALPKTTSRSRQILDTGFDSKAAIAEYGYTAE